jgi:hypothetical protein
MTPSQLDAAIRSTLFRRRYLASRVVERRAAGPASFLGIAATVPLAALRILITLSWVERVSWLCWIWIGFLLLRGVEGLIRPIAAVT